MAHDAVARDRHRVGVGRAGSGDGAHRSRRTDLLGDARVRLRLAGRDLAQRQPDALLEGRAAHVERQGEAVGRRLDQPDHLGHQLLVRRVAADQPRPRKPVLEVAHQRLGIVAEQDRGDTLGARRDEDGTERALADGEGQHLLGAARPVVRRAHAEHAGGRLVEAPVGPVARLVERLGDRCRLGQPLAQPGRAAGHRVGLRRQARGLLEEAVKVVRAELDRLGDLRERERFGRLVDELAGLRHDGVVRRLDGDAARVAAATRRESRRPRPRRRSRAGARSSDWPGATGKRACRRRRSSRRSTRTCRRRSCRARRCLPSAGLG